MYKFLFLLLLPDDGLFPDGRSTLFRFFSLALGLGVGFGLGWGVFSLSVYFLNGELMENC
jgi:hypothetical protein